MLTCPTYYPTFQHTHRDTTYILVLYFGIPYSLVILTYSSYASENNFVCSLWDDRMVPNRIVQWNLDVSYSLHYALTFLTHFKNTSFKFIQRGVYAGTTAECKVLIVSTILRVYSTANKCPKGSSQAGFFFFIMDFRQNGSHASLKICNSTFSFLFEMQWGTMNIDVFLCPSKINKRILTIFGNYLQKLIPWLLVIL